MQSHDHNVVYANQSNASHTHAIEILHIYAMTVGTVWDSLRHLETAIAGTTCDSLRQCLGQPATV